MPTSLIKTGIMTSVVDDEGKTLFPGAYKVYSTQTTDPLALSNDQIIGETHEQIFTGDIPDGCRLLVINIHATATVRVGKDNTGTFVEECYMLPGDPPFMLPRTADASTWYMKASAASIPVRVVAIKIVAPV